MAEVGKLLYIVVEDDEDEREKGKESFRYTRPVLQSTLQLMGCKARHAFKPYIEEFNYPMSEYCAGGNTCVYVNGRELHQKDFELLASRGLPPFRNRSYIIDISGRVLDEESGEELDSLGKLAPTVEKAKHGFGMKVPRAAAR